MLASTMSRRPLSCQEKVTQAIVLWLPTSLLSIPLWDLTLTLFQSFRAERLAHALMDVFLNPFGTLFGLMYIFWLVAEDGIGSIAEHYWPAVLIASAFTAWILSHWWRRD